MGRRKERKWGNGEGRGKAEVVGNNALVVGRGIPESEFNTRGLRDLLTDNSIISDNAL